MTNAEVAKLTVELNLAGNYTSSLGAAEGVTARFAGAGAKIATVGGKIGGALGHAAGQIKNLLTGPLGLIGLTGGLLTFGGAIEQTLGKLNDLAFGTEKLQQLTGGSAQSLSTLIFAAEKYGISLDKLTTSAGFYEKNADKVISKNKDLAKILTDSTGKALPFDQALLAIADEFAHSTDKAKAAADAASVFGRGYTALVPILAQGKQGIIDLEKEAAAMGLQLSDKNVADFAKYRDAIRGSQEAIAGLEVAIGEALLPEITKLADGIRTFVTDHKADIVNFVHGAVDAAEKAAGIIGGLASAVGGFWSSIPAPVRDFLTKGLVADRTIKFLFGFSPVEDIASKLFGRFVDRGSSPANPMYVSGGIGGSSSGGMSILGALGLGSLIVGSADLLGNALLDFFGGKRVNDPGYNPAGTPIAGTPFRIGAAQPYYRRPDGTLYSQPPSTLLNDLVTGGAALAPAAVGAGPLVAAGLALQKAAADLHAGAFAIGSLHERLQHSVLPHSQVNKWLRDADRIAHSSESTADKIKDLQKIKDKLDAGNHHQVYYLDRILAAEKAANSKPLRVTFNANLKMAPNTVYRVTATTFASSGMSNRPVGGGGITNL